MKYRIENCIEKHISVQYISLQLCRIYLNIYFTSGHYI